MKAIPETCHAH